MNTPKFIGLAGWLLSVSVLGVLLLLYLLSFPSDGKNSIVLGFSIQRLLLASGTTIGSLLFAWLGKQPQRLVTLASSRVVFTGLFIGCSLLALLGCLYFLLPGLQRAGPYLGYAYLYLRFTPVILWVGHAGFVGVVSLVALHRNQPDRLSKIATATVLALGLVAYVLLILLAA
ncbi:MAG: hypothetical protein KF701_06715 [Anaerolineales bacterium]|nr:MAG: hypothetical protein KF701_06715 [Anaerolineales bacterium]